MDLSIIIVNWNTREYLERCLASVGPEIKRLAPRNVEVVVVDNRSTDGSSDMVRRDFPSVRLIESEKNLGFAGGNNMALQSSVGEHLLLLNPDTEVFPGAIEGLLKYLEAHPRTGAVGPALLNPDGTLQASAYPAPTLGRELWRLLHLDRLRRISSYPLLMWRGEDSQQVDVIQGACLMTRREVLTQVGMLDEGFFMYTEEVDLCLRIRQAGWNIVWLPSLEVVHHGGQSTRQVPSDMFLQLYRSKIRYFRKHQGASGALRYKAVLLLAIAARLLSGPVALLRVKGEDRDRMLGVMSNYGKLLRHLPSM